MRKTIVTLALLSTIYSCKPVNEDRSQFIKVAPEKTLNIVPGPYDKLIGEYAIKEGGEAKIRITKDNGNYYASILQNNKWSNPENLLYAEDKDLPKVFGQNWSAFVKGGLYKGLFGIFLVEKGYEYKKGRTFKTGYYVLLFGGTDIYKL